MRTAVSGLGLLQPRSLAEALRMMRDEGPLVPLAGCTDLYVGINFGTVAARRFVDLGRLDELRGIRRQAGGGLLVGARETFTALATSALVARRLPMLAQAARQVGGVQIQNRATLGGNIVNASPAADGVPVLAAADAVLVLARAGGQRRVPIAAFYTGYRQTVLAPDELLVAV